MTASEVRRTIEETYDIVLGRDVDGYIERAIRAAETEAYRRGVEDAAMVVTQTEVRRLGSPYSYDGQLDDGQGTLGDAERAIRALLPKTEGTP